MYILLANNPVNLKNLLFYLEALYMYWMLQLSSLVLGINLHSKFL